MPLTLRQLRYFDALARRRHFGQAAEECAVSQPALSMQIRELEAELGVELVERRPNEVALTEIGQEVARRAARLLSGARDLVEFTQHRAGVLRGRLRLGIIPTLGPYLLPAILPALQDRHPDLALEIRETQTRLLLADLARGNVDAVMLALPVDDPDIETVGIFEDPFLLAVPIGDPLPARKRVRPHDVDPAKLILLEEGHCLRDQALAFCGVTPQALPASLGSTSLATVTQMVANGYGVTLVPRVAVDVEVRDARIKLLRFAAPEPARTIGLAWRRSSSRKTDYHALAKIVGETVGAGALRRTAEKKAARRPPLD
jgi:LysR family hydrogen peroxide-inducible transcriptional activator